MRVHRKNRRSSDLNTCLWPGLVLLAVNLSLADGMGAWFWRNERSLQREGRGLWLKGWWISDGGSTGMGSDLRNCCQGDDHSEGTRP